jgi:hypothetical protein
MKRTLLNHSLKLMMVFLLFGVLNGCQKNDHFSDRMAPTQQSTGSMAACKATQESADVVYQWYKFMAKLQLLSLSPGPLPSFRNFAYIGIGLYEAVQPGIKGGSSLSPKLYQMPAMPKADMSKDYLWGASANAALASMFKLFLTNLTEANKVSIDSLEKANYDQFALTTSDDVLKRSQDFGRSIATVIYNWSTSDNFTISGDGYTFIDKPWAWALTPPDFAAPIGVHVGESRPFLKYSLTAMAPPIPIPFSTDPSSKFYNAAKEVYDIGVNLTEEQKATALWWADAGGTGVGLPPPYHFLHIVTSLLESQHAGLWKAAEVYAKTGVAVKDGPIITFRSKYHYNLLRPVTYIQRYLNIGNSATWLAFLNNPPYPDYTSGLVGVYSPFTQVLIREFGDIPITDSAYNWRGLPARKYNSISDLRKDAAYSRVLAGIHYRFTQDVSIEMGKALGDLIAKVQIVGPKY